MKKLIACVLLFIGSLNAQLASSVPYGNGCRGARLVVDVPRIGSKIFATVPSHPKGSIEPIILGISIVEQNHNLGYGCNLLIYPMWDWVYLIPHTHRGPNGIYMGRIIDDPGLVGLVFFVQAAANGSYELVFGNDTFGRKLTDGNIVEATYRVASGAEPDGANTFTSAGAISGYSTVAATVVERAAGGQEYQSLDDIKFAAPRALTTQERAVTANDYKTLVQNEFGDITDMNVYGGDEASPPQFGKVVMVASSNTYDTLPSFQKQQIIDFIGPKSPLTIEPIMQDPTFLRIEVDCKVTYNMNETSSNQNGVQTIVKSAITTFNTNNLGKFNKTFRQSKLIEKINESDTSILSNSIQTRMIKEINPILNQGFTNTVSFFNPLRPDNPVTVAQGASLPYSEPAIESGLFTFNSTSGASFRDDGDGAIQIVVANTSALTILNANVGEVDYATGNVTFSNVSVNAIATGTTIKIYARSEDADIAGKLNDLIEIKTDDTTVTVKGIRE